MNIARRFALALSGVAMFLGAHAARADVARFTAASGVWSQASNWSSNPNLPQPADRVVIEATHSCTVSTTDVTVDTVEIQSGAFLNVGVGRTLTLTNTHDNIAGTPDNSIISGGANGLGVLSLHLSNTVGGKLRFSSATHTLTGAGGGSGAGTTAQFENRGLVKGEGGSTMTLGASLDLLDVPGAEWKVAGSLNSSGSGLLFLRVAALTGDFTGNCDLGHFTFAATVSTCGTFTRNGSAVTVTEPGNDAVVFAYSSWAAGSPSSCPDPAGYVGYYALSCADTTSIHVVSVGSYSGCACP